MLPVQYARSSLHQKKDVNHPADVLPQTGEQIVGPPQIVVKDAASNDIVHPGQDPPQLNVETTKVLHEQGEPETPNKATVETQKLSSMSKAGPTPAKTFVDI